MVKEEIYLILKETKFGNPEVKRLLSRFLEDIDS